PAAKEPLKKLLSSTGDPPVAPGDSLGAKTPSIAASKSGAYRARDVSPVPVGGSPTSTGESPVLPHPALEALWSLHQAGWLDGATALVALEHPAAPVRAWAIRLLGDRKQLPDAFTTAVERLAATEPDAEVRCQIASTARRLPARQALPLVAALLGRDADA